MRRVCASGSQVRRLSGGAPRQCLRGHYRGRSWCGRRPIGSAGRSTPRGVLALGRSSTDCSRPAEPKSPRSLWGASGQRWSGSCEIGEGSPYIVDVCVCVIGQTTQDPDQQIICTGALGILCKGMRTSRPLIKAGKCRDDFRGLYVHFCGLQQENPPLSSVDLHSSARPVGVGVEARSADFTGPVEPRNPGGSGCPGRPSEIRELCVLKRANRNSGSRSPRLAG